MEMKAKIAPSLLSADFACLSEQLSWLDELNVEYIFLSR